MTIQQEQAIALSLKVGGLMLESNAEIYRAEEIMVRILASYGLDQVEIFTLATCIYLTVEVNEGHVTRIKRIYKRSTDLQMIANLNQFSRDIAKQIVDVDEALKIIEQIQKEQNRKLYKKVLWISLSCAFFGIMFNESITLLEFILTFVITALTYLFSCFLNRGKLNLYISNLLLSAFMTLFACLSHYFHFTKNPDIIVIGTIMVLVPGVAVTNAVRDTINGDILSGTIRTLEAIIAAFGIASGVILVLYAYSLGGTL